MIQVSVTVAISITLPLSQLAKRHNLWSEDQRVIVLYILLSHWFICLWWLITVSNLQPFFENTISPMMALSMTKKSGWRSILGVFRVEIQYFSISYSINFNSKFYLIRFNLLTKISWNTEILAQIFQLWKPLLVLWCRWSEDKNWAVRTPENGFCLLFVPVDIPCKPYLRIILRRRTPYSVNRLGLPHSLW